jgi:ribonuclease HII
MLQSKKLPDFHFEQALWNKGMKFVAGGDEVGRGAFAGPLVTAIVIFQPEIVQITKNRDVLINDSKLLTAKQRLLASKWIKKNSIWSIGKATTSEINTFGITKATHMAFRRAVNFCQQEIDYLLMDAFYIPYLKGASKAKQKPIIKGDQKSVSIASASIIAKVYRDALMIRLSQKHREYNWHLNKGYGTKMHCQAILNYGKSTLHRTKFVDSFIRKKLN